MRRKSLRLGCLKWFARFYERRRASGVRRLSAGISCLESLEERTLLASVSDSGGDTLTIDLATIDESLTIASDGTSYTFTSTQNFTNADVQNLGDFSSFGATTLTLSNLERYASIRITDSQSGTSVRFVDNSMVGIFHQDFEILLDDGNQQAWMTVEGELSFGNHSLTATAGRSIRIEQEASIEVEDGHLTLTANPSGNSSGNFSGLLIDGASLRSTGLGVIDLTGTGGADSNSNSHTGVQISGGAIVESTSDSGGGITITGNGGLGGRGNRGVWIEGAGTEIGTNAGGVLIQGTGGGPTSGFSSDNHGVQISSEALVQTQGGGSLTVQGAAGLGGINNFGVLITDSKTRVASAEGNLVISGKGGFHGEETVFQTIGVFIANGGFVESTGTGTISLSGEIGTLATDGSETANGAGIQITDGTVASHTGDITLTGSASQGNAIGLSTGTVTSTGTGAAAAEIQLNGTTLAGSGVAMILGSKVSAIDGNVTLVGTGGTAGTHDSRGIDLLHDSRVEVVNGQMVIQGTGMGDGNDPLNKGSLGVRLSQNSGGQLISQGTGGITIVGQGDGLYEGFLVGADSIVGGPDAAGPISILSDSIRIDTTDPGTPVIQSSGPLTIQAIDGVLSLGLGDGATGELNLTNHELSFLADGFAELSFGFSKQFAGVVDLNHPVLKDDVTIQAGTIDLDGLASPGNSVEFQLNGGVLTSPDGLASHSVSAASIIVDGVLAPGTANGQVLIDGDLTFSPSSKFTVELFGTFPGTGYDQLVVNGAVHLGGIPLVTQLNYSPNITDSFVLVDNLGSGPIVGTFEGLPEASSIDLNGTHFFLTYQGGDGNDIALEQNNPPSLELSKSSVTLAENVNTSQSILISEIQVIDDGWGTNVLSLAGDDSNLFEIVNSKLYLKAGTKLDFESESVFHVRVNIDDPEIGANPDASVAVIVEISDANDAPVATGFTTNVPGNASQGTLLGTVTGQDEDQGQTLSYSITAGNDLGIFAIGGTSGAVTVANAAALSRNDGTTQRLTITVSDNGVPLRTGTSEVTITIEKAPVTLSVETVSTSISENGGTTITKVSRSGNPSLPLTVQLHVDDPTEANIPSSVTFASGQSTVTTTLGAVDDPFVDGSQLVNITVSAVGSNPAQTQITIEDDDTLRPGQDLLLFDEDSRTFKLGTNTGTGFAWFESDTLAMNPGVLESYIGDFDGDGDLDGAVRHQDTKAVRVLLNNGDGTLSTPVSRGTVGTAGEAGFLQVGDYDGDGADELLWMYRNGSYSGFIFLKRLTPAATSHYMINANPGYDAMVTGDFNGDGFDDLVGLYDNASGTQTNIIPFYSIASTNPSFPRRLRAIGTAPTQGRFGESVAIGGLSEFQAVDLNGDGRDDLIAKTTQGTTPGQILHATTTGDVAGDGTLFVGVHRFVSSNRAPDFEPLEYPRAILTGNFDDALGRDLAMVTSTGQFHVSRATTNSAFLNPVVLRNPAGSWGTGSTNDDLLVGDWNGDGFHDLLSLTNRATVFLSTSSSFGVALDFGPIIGGPLGMVGAISPA